MPALGCLCWFGQCARHPSIHGPLLVLCQRPWVSSLSFHMEVRKGPMPFSPLDSHLIGQHQSLVWVRVPNPSWLSLFPGSIPAVAQRTWGRLIDSEPLAGSGSVFLPSVIYRTAVRVAQSAASTRTLALLVSVTHVDDWSEQLVGYFIQCAPALLVWSYGTWAGAECQVAAFQSWAVGP